MAWWQLWIFIKCQAKFNRFLYPNEHIQKIFWYLVRLFESELSKIGNFQSSKSFSGRSNEICPLKIILNFENFQFLTALTQKLLQGINKSFEYAHWDTKINWIWPKTLWNSTTVTMLLHTFHKNQHGENYELIHTQSEEWHNDRFRIT